MKCKHIYLIAENLEGLVHISEIDWGLVVKTRDVILFESPRTKIGARSAAEKKRETKSFFDFILIFLRHKYIENPQAHQ